MDDDEPEALPIRGAPISSKPQILNKTDTVKKEFESEQKTPEMEENIAQSGTSQIQQESELQSYLDNTKKNVLSSELKSDNVEAKIEQPNLMNNFNGQSQSNVQSQNGQEPIYRNGSYEQTHHQNYPKVLPEIIKPYPANTLYPSQFEQNFQTSAYSEFQANKPEIEKWPAKTISEYVEPLPANTLYR